MGRLKRCAIHIDTEIVSKKMEEYILCKFQPKEKLLWV